MNHSRSRRGLLGVLAAVPLAAAAPPVPAAARRFGALVDLGDARLARTFALHVQGEVLAGGEQLLGHTPLTAGDGVFEALHRGPAPGFGPPRGPHDDRPPPAGWDTLENVR